MKALEIYMKSIPQRKDMIVRTVTPFKGLKEI